MECGLVFPLITLCGFGRLTMTMTMTAWRLPSASPSVNEGVRCRQDHHPALSGWIFVNISSLCKRWKFGKTKANQQGEDSHELKSVSKCFFRENRDYRGVLYFFSFNHVAHVTICFLKKKEKEKKKHTSSTTFMATGCIFSPVLWHRPAWHLISAPKDTSEIQKEPKNNCLKWQRTTSQSRGDLHCLSIKHSGLWRILMRNKSCGNKCEQSASRNEGNWELVFWEQSVS